MPFSQQFPMYKRIRASFLNVRTECATTDLDSREILDRFELCDVMLGHLERNQFPSLVTCKGIWAEPHQSRVHCFVLVCNQ